MKIQQNKTKKFHKKTHFLQISLLKFLYWRDTNSNKSWNEKHNTLNTECDIEKTIEQELLLVRNFLPFFKNNKSFLNKLSTNTFFEKNMQKGIDESSILSNFFPQRQSFMYYWILPFVGFVGLAYLNQNNQFKFHPSLELWPYLKKTVIAEKTYSDLQNTHQIPFGLWSTKEKTRSKQTRGQYDTDAILEAMPFSRDHEAKAEHVFPLCWETLEYLNYKKCLYDESKKYVNEIYTSEDNLYFVVKPNWIEHQQNQYSITFKDLNLSNQFTKISDIEKREIENLWKFYFYETRDFIYSQLRETSSTQAAFQIPNQYTSKKQAQNSLNASSVDFAQNQTIKHEPQKSKGTLLENLGALNLWNRSSIRWYWYQINPSHANMSLISKNSLENSWLGLDEFPKKIFPVPMSSNTREILSHQIALSASDKKSLTVLSKPMNTLKDQYANECIMHDEKDSTLGLFLNLNTQPIQSYKKSSLLLDNWMKKLHLDTKSIMHQIPLKAHDWEINHNSSNDYEAIKRKNDFISIIENKLNSIDKLKYRQPKGSLCFYEATNPNISELNSVNASDMLSVPTNLTVSNGFSVLVESDLGQTKSQRPKVRLYRTEDHIKSKMFITTSAKKQISKDLRKIFCLKHFSFKTKNSRQQESKNISKTNKNRVSFNDVQNYFDSTKKNISNERAINYNLMTQLKLLNSYRKFITQPINELIHSPYKTLNSFENNCPSIQVEKQHLELSFSPHFNDTDLTREKINVSDKKQQLINLGRLKGKLDRRVDSTERKTREIKIEFDNIRSLKRNIYQLSVLRKFNQHLKKNSLRETQIYEHPSKIFDDSEPMATKIKFIFDDLSSISFNKQKRYETNQDEIRASRVTSKIHWACNKLSYSNRNFHLNEILKKAKNAFLTKQNQKYVGFDMNKSNPSNEFVVKLQNALIMSGYEFPEFRIKDVFMHKNNLSKKYFEKNEKHQNNIKYIVSLPPTFSKSIHGTLKVTALSPAKNEKNKSSLFADKTQNQYHNVNIKKQNSFLFQNYNDFFTLFKQNSISNLNSYWSHNGQKNKMLCTALRSRLHYTASQIVDRRPQTAEKNIDGIKSSVTMQKDIVERHIENSEKTFFHHKKQWIYSAHSKINSFYQYFQKIVRLLFIKLNSLLKQVVHRIQHKMLDQHNFESYVIFDSLNDSSFFEKPHLERDLKTIYRMGEQWPRYFFHFKTLKKQQNQQKMLPCEIKRFDEGQVESIAPRKANTASPRVFKLDKTKKYLKNSIVFKNLEKRKIEKIFRTYLSCKANEVLLSDKGTIAPNDNNAHNEFVVSQKTRIKTSTLNSHYITNALKRLQIRAKHNLLIHSTRNQKNNMKKLFVFKTTNKKQNSTSFNKTEIKEVDRLIEKNTYAPIAANGRLLNDPNSMNFIVCPSDGRESEREIFLFARKYDADIAHHKNKKTSRNKHYSMKFYQLSPNSVLKRLGFIFLNQSDKSFHGVGIKKYDFGCNRIFPTSKHDLTLDNVSNKISESFFQNDEMQNEKYSSHHEKQKYNQKKRRRKKQKLENRRRKKRKRFYPRPKWLRFELYKNFLKKRHFKHQINCDFDDTFNLNAVQNYHSVCGAAKLKKMRDFDVYKTQNGASFDETNSYEKQMTRFNYFETKAFKRILKTKIYRQNKQQWGFCASSSENPNFEKLTIKKMPLSWSLPIFANHDLYQISNVVMSDFQRLCWKSYWLRSNLTPYIHRIQSSLKKLQLSQIHEQSSTTLKTFVSHLLGFNLPQVSSHLFNDQIAKESIRRNSVTLNSALNGDYSVVPLHTRNIRGNMRADYSVDQKPKHIRWADTSEMSNYSNKPSIFLTGKKSPQLSWYLNVRQSFQTRNVISNFSLFQNTQNIAEYNRILCERISDIIKNVRTNLNVNGQNHARSFKRGRRKNQKTASNPKNLWTRLGRELSPEIRAFSPFATTIDTSIKPYGDLPTLRVLWALNKTNVLTFKQNNAVKNLWTTLKNREQNKSNKTKKFISNSWKKIFPENFEKYCFRKAFFVEDKIRHSGFIKKDYENYLIRLKMQFKSIDVHNSTSDVHISEFSGRALRFKKQSPESDVYKQNTFHSIADTKQTMVRQIFNSDSSQPQTQSQNHPKRSMFFWWTCFSQIHKGSMFMQQTFMLPNWSITQSSLLNFTIVSSLWTCTVLFHVCSLFFVLNIPEIRSLMKFNLLIFYKLSNSYLIVIYSIYDLLKNYKNQIINSFGFAYPRLINKTTRLISRDTSLKSNYEPFEHKTKYASNKMYFSPVTAPQKQTSTSRIKKTHKKTNSRRITKYNTNAICKDPNYGTSTHRTQRQAPFKEIHYLSKNGTFLETTFRVPTQLHENFILGVSSNERGIFSRDTYGKNARHFFGLGAYGDGNIIYSVCKAVQNKNYSKIKALWDVIELEIQNRTNDSHIFDMSKHESSLVDTNKSTSEANQIPWQEKTQQHKSKQNNKTNIIMRLIDKNEMADSSNQQSMRIKTAFFADKTQINSYVFITELISKKYITPIQSLISLAFLRAAKLSIVVIDNCAQLCYKTLFKFIDILESFMLIIYKFLEKPAELMIDWIAQIFLVEWSSDILTYLPEALDSSIWNSHVLLSRSSRIAGPIGFLLQRRIWCFMEIFIDFVSKPDADLLMRQRKGTIFWNIWAEILIQAAERYNINVQSLTTLKEEQELLIEKLLEDENWDWTRRPMGEQFKTSMNKTHDEMIPLIKMIENQRPQNWWNITRQLADIDEHELPLSVSNGQTRDVSSASQKQNEGKRAMISLPVHLKHEIRPIVHFFNKGSSKQKYAKKAPNNKLGLFSLWPSVESDQSQAKSQRIGRVIDASLLHAQSFGQGHSNASNIWRRWSVNQYFTYQGKDTDLFIDIHPPKSFRHISAIKYYQPAQQTLGSLVCQIYSGTFSKQVSKNILVVGAPGIGKSLLVQALAGETELKIITDNAHRYALVQRGVAIGMKLLRDVFDAIALHTPCLFLMEDIHVIGERRPMLISDDENAKATESFFASENEEVHEKNQLIYQLNKHAISHYKKPYKGDFSLLIPTNHFCFDLFLGVSPPKTRRSGMTPKSPLDISSIENELNKSHSDLASTASSEQSSLGASSNTLVSTNKRFPFETLVSHLQIPSDKYFAPPPTSPFTILMMKEQKKLLPKKLVKQIPWSGLSWDQMMLVSKVSYSIRVKVALLADVAISNLSVKLDMITDLLVIMDSVRSNRGFVVFATTHAPFILDPALRRPGRLDETISLPSLPNLINRWEIFKANLSSYTHTLDFVDYSLLSVNLTDTQISNFISKTKLLLFNTKETRGYFDSSSHSLKYAPNQAMNYVMNYVSNTHKTIYSLNQAVNIATNADILEPSQITKRIQRALTKVNKNKNDKNSSSNKSHGVSPLAFGRPKGRLYRRDDYTIGRVLKNTRAIDKTHNQNRPNSLLRLLRSFDVYPAIHEGSSNLISLTYFQMGKFLINSQLVFDRTSYGRITWSKFLVSHNLEEHIFRDLYGARYDLNNILMRLFSGKVGEFFIFNNSSLCRYFYSTHSKTTSHERHRSSKDTKTTHWSSNTNEMKINTQTSATLSASSFLPDATQQNFITTAKSKFSDQPSPMHWVDIKKSHAHLIQNGFQHNGFWNLVGIHPFWNSANSFVCSLMQKRYLYNKNLLVSRMLYFEDVSTRREPPSPPNSSILMPAKKYENLKRTENDFQQKANMSIHDKIRLHQQQRLMKKLYDRPINEYFRSEMIENRFTKFNSSIKELGYLNSFARRPSSVNSYYKNRILIRHKFSLMNQWWNGQLAEHNTETTFLSDVDWRSIFNKSLGDLLIDFPDADQHYNPRHRRWFLQSSYWGYWNTFDKTMTQEISYHFMIQCFNKAYNFLNNEREILDYFAYSFLQKGILNEIHLVTTLSRFYNSPATVLK
uniref:Cell division protein n=1 Tax=Bracteacoccus giganteus TaxID=50039 RepID=A0A0S2LQH4_9CHLO|nr:cell division protein [Bracteacoccus giganteus]ALO63498.1 cell division protein [Bracteacoccus giganteus]